VDDLQLAALVEGMRQAVGAEGFVRQQMAILGRPDSRPLLAKIDCRTLVVVGEGDQLTPPALAQEISSSVPGAKLAIIPGAGHLAPMERPEAVNAVLQRWLSQA
jgi:alpha/beta hydrolase protein